MKKIVYHNPATDEMFSAKNVLKQMLESKDKLIKSWGEEAYLERLEAIQKWIATKPKPHISK